MITKTYEKEKFEGEEEKIELFKFIMNLAEKPTISDKNYGKNCYLGTFVFLLTSPS